MPTQYAGEWITLYVLEVRCPVVLRGSPSGFAAASGPWHGSGAGGILEAQPAAALAPHAPAEGRDTACRHCPSEGYLGLPRLSGVAFFLEDKREKEHQLMLSDRAVLPSIKTVVLVSGTHCVPSPEKSEVQKDGVRD